MNERAHVEAATVRCYTKADGRLRFVLDVPARDAVDAFRMLGAPGQTMTLTPTTQTPALLKARKQPELTPEQRAERAARWREKGNLQRAAITLCRTAEFQAYLGVSTEQHAADILRSRCGIETRSELDDNEHAQRVFQALLVNFRAWQARGEVGTM